MAVATVDPLRLKVTVLPDPLALGEIDPELFDGFALALPEAMRQARAQGKEPPGFLAILNKFRSKDLRRGLVAVNSLLEAWGKDFFSEAHSQSKK